MLGVSVLGFRLGVGNWFCNVIEGATTSNIEKCQVGNYWIHGPLLICL